MREDKYGLTAFPPLPNSAYRALRRVAVLAALAAFTMAALHNGWPRPWPVIHLVSWGFWVAVSMVADWEFGATRKRAAWPRRDLFLMMDIYVPLSTAMMLFDNLRPVIFLAATLVFVNLVVRGIGGWLTAPVAFASLFSTGDALEQALSPRGGGLALLILGLAVVCGMAWHHAGAWLWRSLLMVPEYAGLIEMGGDDEDG